MRGRKADLKVIDGGLLDALPQAPLHFSEVQAAEWAVIVVDLRDRKLLTATMLGPIEVYVMALSNVRQAQKALDEHGALIANAEGILRPNPVSGMLWRSQTIVTRLAAELGLTPAARSKAIHAPKEEDDDLFSLLDI